MRDAEARIIPTMVVCRVTMVASDNWPSQDPLKFPTPHADDHPHRPLPRRSAAWVVVRGRWRRIWL